MLRKLTNSRSDTTSLRMCLDYQNQYQNRLLLHYDNIENDKSKLMKGMYQIAAACEAEVQVAAGHEQCQLRQHRVELARLRPASET